MQQNATSSTGPPSSQENSACCTAVDHDLSEPAITGDVRTLRAMGNETRYEVLRLLSGTEDAVCACDLVPEVDVDQSTTSRALKSLYEAGLLDRRKDGRWRYYSTTSRADTILRAIDASRGDRS